MSTEILAGPGDWLTLYQRDPAKALAPVWHTLNGWLPLVGAAAAAITVIAVAAALWVPSWRRARLADGARVVTVIAPAEIAPKGGAAFWANMSGLVHPAWKRAVYGQSHLVWEWEATADGISTRVWAPSTVPAGLVERAIRAAWPGALTTTEPATPPIPVTTPAAVVTMGELRLGARETLPLAAHSGVPDPVHAVLSAASGLGPSEHVCVQIAARPATVRRTAHTQPSAPPLSPRTLIAGAAGLLTGILRLGLDFITPGHTHTTGSSPLGYEADHVTQIQQRATDHASADKLAGPLFEGVIRYAVTIPAGADPAIASATARGRAHAIATAYASYNGANHLKRHRLRRPGPINGRWLGRGSLLSLGELAALAHLPTDTTAFTGDQARELAAPPAVLNAGPGVVPLGYTGTGRKRLCGIRVPDTRYNEHVLGAIGSGKSTYLAGKILDYAENGRGVVAVDIKGDLIRDVICRLPESAGNRVVLMDPHGISGTAVPCINPFDTTAGRDLAVDNIVSVFHRLFPGAWGPRTDDLMRAACLTLTHQATTPTLADLPGLLTDPAGHSRLIRAVKDPILRGFWTWYTSLTPPAQAQISAPLMNKLRAALLKPFARAAIAAGPSTVDLSEVLDGGILLIRIPKGELGEDTARMVGSLIIASVWQAVTARASIPEAQRRDALVVVDEFHNLIHVPYPFEDMLAEARAYRAPFVLAHQNTDQLSTELRKGVAANARNKLFLSMSAEDAKDLARHTEPYLTSHDLANLPAYHGAARIVVDGQQIRPFTVALRPLTKPKPGRNKLIRAHAATNARAAAAAKAAGPTAETPGKPGNTTRPYDPRLDGF